MVSYPVVEKFISINGEGPLAGAPAAFIRFRGCNLSCSYCDTAWANDPDCPCTMLTAAEIEEWLFAAGITRVTLTGGEPLRIPRIDALITALGEAGYRVEIETNGSVGIGAFCTLNPRPAFTVDYKCPSSGMESCMDLQNARYLQMRDSVKFVVGDRADLERAYEIAQTCKLNGRCGIFLSPVFGRIDPKEIVEFLITHRWNEARLQLQLHKYIWPPDQRGV